MLGGARPGGVDDSVGIMLLWLNFLVLANGRLLAHFITVSLATMRFGRGRDYHGSFFTFVRMAERSKALRSGRSPLLWAWVRIPLLTADFWATFIILVVSSTGWGPD